MVFEDPWSKTGFDFEKPLIGSLIRWVDKRERSVLETFEVYLSEASVSLAVQSEVEERRPRECAEIVQFSIQSTWGPELLYQKSVSDPSNRGFKSSGPAVKRKEVELDGIRLLDLANAIPMKERAFWRLASVLTDVATLDTQDRLIRDLSGMEISDIVAFQARLFELEQRLNQPQIILNSRDNLAVGSDGFLLWRLGIVLLGKAKFYEVLANGLLGELPDKTWESAELLRSVGALSYEVKCGVSVEFWSSSILQSVVTEASDYAGKFDYSLRGDGSIDLIPGPRNAPDMFRRGLLPRVVGSRFLVKVGIKAIECVAFQHIDDKRENLRLHLAEGADELALRMGGTVASDIDWTVAYTAQLSSGLEILRVKTPKFAVDP